MPYAIILNIDLLYIWSNSSIPCLSGNILIGSGKVLVPESYWAKVSPPPKVVSGLVAPRPAAECIFNQCQLDSSIQVTSPSPAQPSPAQPSTSQDRRRKVFWWMIDVWSAGCCWLLLARPRLRLRPPPTWVSTRRSRSPLPTPAPAGPITAPPTRPASSQPITGQHLPANTQHLGLSLPWHWKNSQYPVSVYSLVSS